MNTLEHWLADNGVDERSAMNWLQCHGEISDNCVMAADVADADCQKAIEFLAATKELLKKGFPLNTAV